MDKPDWALLAPLLSPSLPTELRTRLLAGTGNRGAATDRSAASTDRSSAPKRIAPASAAASVEAPFPGHAADLVRRLAEARFGPPPVDFEGSGSDRSARSKPPAASSPLGYRPEASMHSADAHALSAPASPIGTRHGFSAGGPAAEMVPDAPRHAMCAPATAGVSATAAACATSVITHSSCGVGYWGLSAAASSSSGGGSGAGGFGAACGASHRSVSIATVRTDTLASCIGGAAASDGTVASVPRATAAAASAVGAAAAAATAAAAAAAAAPGAMPTGDRYARSPMRSPASGAGTSLGSPANGRGANASASSPSVVSPSKGSATKKSGVTAKPLSPTKPIGRALAGVGMSSAMPMVCVTGGP